MIIGRNAELNQLGTYYFRDKSQILVLYGQKNIGKTALLKEFMQDKPGFYYCAESCSDREQRYKIGQWLASQDIKTLKYPEFSDVFKCFSNIHTQKKVIVFDEFQNIIKSSPDFMRELSKFIHLNWKTEEYLVILASSSISFVENSLVSKIGDSAFEISGFLKIKELSFAALKEYFSFYSAEDCFLTYSILGGVPGYWKMFDEHLSVKDNIVNSIIRKSGALNAQGNSLVSEELRETQVYNTILYSLCEGKNKLNDLYEHTGFSRAKISVYLRNLMEFEFVKKIYSIDSKGYENTKKGLYDISNNFLAFYYSFIYKYSSFLEMLKPEEFYNKYVAPALKQYASRYFADVCMESITNLNEKKRLPINVSSMGSWYGKQGNIDIVASSENGKNILCICEYDKPMLTYDDYEWLLFTADKADIKPDYIYLFSGTRFDEKLSLEAKVRKNLTLFLLEDLK